MPRLYHYVGPEEIRAKAADVSPGVTIDSTDDLAKWLKLPSDDGLVPATFVVDEEGNLRLANRRTEHVACAGGGPVLSAGEMFFLVLKDGIRLEEASNQSTGYCPEPESWPAVASALDRIGVPHPGRFTQEIVFRRCAACGQRNIVKEDWFVCGVCGADLPQKWNF
jgi:hypothetical protein